MTAEANEATIRRWIEAYNARDAQAEAAVRTPGFTAHVAGVSAPLDDEAWTGFIDSFSASFPDLRLTVEDVVASDDRVAARVSFRGTHSGAFQGIPPTGRQVTFSSLEFNRMANGKVAEHWVNLDMAGLLQQLQS
jgi:steroid delta-isomerase-like uncharacterized protein